jgi:hypothetical protein
MLFNNPEIIKSSADSRIGGVDVDQPNIDFDNYLYEVKLRILYLVCKFTDEQMYGGAMSREEAINEARGQIYNYLHIIDKDFSNDEMVLAEQIMESKEFIDWKVKIYYRFQDMHHLNVGNAVPVNFERNQESEETMEEEENLFTILEGLVAQYK